MANPARKLMTVAEFAAYDDGTERRYELIGGELVLMAPPLRRHRVLSARLAQLLNNRLRPPCLAEVEAGIVLPWSANDYYEADVAVSCAPVGRELWCPDPLLIVEILSRSTGGKDRDTKLPAYRRLPSVRDILVVATDEALIEHHARDTGGPWDAKELGAGGLIRLDVLGVEIAVDELYTGLLRGPIGEGAG